MCLAMIGKAAGGPAHDEMVVNGEVPAAVRLLDDSDCCRHTLAVGDHLAPGRGGHEAQRQGKKQQQCDRQQRGRGQAPVAEPPVHVQGQEEIAGADGDESQLRADQRQDHDPKSKRSQRRAKCVDSEQLAEAMRRAAALGKMAEQRPHAERRQQEHGAGHAQLGCETASASRSETIEHPLIQSGREPQAGHTQGTAQRRSLQ